MLKNYLKNEVKFNIENIVNDICNWQEDFETTKTIEDFTSKDINEIVKRLLENEGFIDYLNEFINSEIENEIYHYLKEKEGK